MYNYEICITTVLHTYNTNFTIQQYNKTDIRVRIHVQLNGWTWFMRRLKHYSFAKTVMVNFY